MSEQSELVTVFRSADDEAEEDARAIAELFSAQGLSPVVLDDSAPGVPEGAWEVQVAPSQVGRAEELIAEARLPDEDLTDVDESSGLDMETVFSASSGTTQEMEATAVRSILEDAGIATVTIGDAVLPNLAFEIRVSERSTPNGHARCSPKPRQPALLLQKRQSGRAKASNRPTNTASNVMRSGCDRGPTHGIPTD